MISRADNLVSHLQTPCTFSLDQLRASAPAADDQFGLKDRIKGREINYPAREPLGITTQEVEQLEEVLLAHLTKDF